METSGDGGGGLTTTGLICAACGTQLPPNSKFCNECGAPLAPATRSAEYKQVTVLFADVVHSMDIAAAVGAERLREIMMELVDCTTKVVQRYGGTVDKFTGDGIMAVFGAPLALEDHAVRACLAALDIQKEAERLAGEVRSRDGIALRLRIGLNSGQVVVGEIGSGPLNYTAIGDQVGMAQRMESIARPGGVMLSESTAGLVEDIATLAEREMVHVKGAEEPVPARRLLGMAAHRTIGRRDAAFVGRQWEMTALRTILDRSKAGKGCVVNVVGAPGIGKSRIVRETAAVAAGRGVEVFSTFCESHASDIPFYAVTRLLRAVAGVEGCDRPTARAQMRTTVPRADPQDLLLLDDLLGIADPDVALPDIDPDARRRRLTALVKATSLARTKAALYVVEDAHWIDKVSESMFADFISVIPQTPSMVLITYRPEYRGALARIAGSQTISLHPLSDSETSELVTELLGSDASVQGVTAMIAPQAGGNPFFAEEIVRDLAERGVLIGDRGHYVCQGYPAEASVPATLQTTIAARIDRLSPSAKRTLSAAAVIGSRFTTELVARLEIDPTVDELINSELIEPAVNVSAEYEFRQPLIRSVAYDSQLKSHRAELHRKVAAAIEQCNENAALIAGHLEAAGDLHGAYSWHMRAADWSTTRDITAARTSWLRARRVADGLPASDPDRKSMQIAPRTLLCGTAWRARISVTDSGFDELRELCTATSDQVWLAIGMTGLVVASMFHLQNREASRLASELLLLLEAIDDPTLTVALTPAAIYAKQEAGQVSESLRLAQQVIDLADGDPTKGNLLVGSPLAFATAWRGAARCFLGIPGWKADLDRAVEVGRAVDPMSLTDSIMYKYLPTIANGALLPDAQALRETAETLAITEQSRDDLMLAMARLTRGVTLVCAGGVDRQLGFDILAKVREAALHEQMSMLAVPLVDIQTAAEKTRTGDLDGAIELSKAAIDNLFASGEMIWCGHATTIFVEGLLQRGTDDDVQEAQSAIDKLAAVPTDPGLVLHELPLLRLRALLSRARGDETAYRELAKHYRAKAESCDFKGHMALAEAMT